MKQIVCESMRVIEGWVDWGVDWGVGGWRMSSTGKGRREGEEKQREREYFHLLLLEKHLILG